MPHIAGIVGILARASVLSAVAGAAFAQASDSGAEAGELEEIVVTATRSAQAASRVPVSLAAYTQEGLDSQGVRQIDDVTRLTPGVQFNRSGYGLTSNIAIRGISSGAGSATTGIYIDDTPIQVRSIGNSASNAYPAIFDLERVEVLRGPQGTLFGAGSQGGTVRFISPSPVLGGDLQGYSRAEIATTRRGALTYEAGAALGGAVVEDKVGFRLSGYTRRDGGFVDRVPYPDGNGSNPSLGFPKKDSNSVETQSARLALTFKPTDDFAITPSVYYQNLKSNDTAVYWESVFGTPISDRGSGRYVNGNKIASTNKDSFVLPALKLRWDLGAVTLSSDTSYFRRRESGIYDYGAFINNIFGFGSDPTPTLSIPGNYDLGRLSNAQNNLTQELRLNSSDADARLTYVLGLFLSRDKQRSHQDIVNPYFESIVGMPVDVFYGLPRSPEGYTYVDNFFTTDKQTAVFGELGYEVAAGLRVIAGLRYARTRLDFRTTRDGPAQGGPGSDSGQQKENPLTPKLGLSYQVNPSNLVYATAAKGFRIGGVNRGIPTNATCGADLAAIGLTEAPTSYDSDKVWSYEVGSKNRLADGRMRIATSAYYIKWRDIVNFVNLPNCGFAFTDNLGSATIRGFDLQVDVQPRDELTLGLAVGYNRGTYDKTIASGGPKNLITKGYTTGGAPWVIAASGQYDFVLGGRDSYFRVDVSHRTRNNGLTDISDPQGPDYDPQVPRNPALTDVRLRAGMMFGGLDLSAFVNNATNEHDRMFVDHVTTYGQIFQAAPVRPITMGVSAAYRF